MYLLHFQFLGGNEYCIMPSGHYVCLCFLPAVIPRIKWSWSEFIPSWHNKKVKWSLFSGRNPAHSDSSSNPILCFIVLLHLHHKYNIINHSGMTQIHGSCICNCMTETIIKINIYHWWIFSPAWWSFMLNWAHGIACFSYPLCLPRMRDWFGLLGYNWLPQSSHKGERIWLSIPEEFRKDIIMIILQCRKWNGLHLDLCSLCKAHVLLTATLSANNGYHWHLKTWFSSTALQLALCHW